jgi:DNA-directed RNA polymerase specialized sigma24 family protein
MPWEDSPGLNLHDGPGLSPEDAALHRVRLRLAPKTFQMFDLYVCQGLPLSTVMEILDVSAARVLWAKFRVQRALRAELSRFQ